MAVSYLRTGTVTLVGGGATFATTVMPTQATGDFLVCDLSWSGSGNLASNTVGTPAGWTLIANSVQYYSTNGITATQAAYYKVAASSSEAAPSFTSSAGTPANNEWRSSISVYSGATGIGTTSTQGGTSASQTLAGVTSASAGWIEVVASAVYDYQAGGMSTPAGYTNIVLSGRGGADLAQSVNYQTQASSGTSSSVTLTNPSSGVNNYQMAAIAYAITAAAAATRSHRYCQWL